MILRDKFKDFDKVKDRVIQSIQYDAVSHYMAGDLTYNEWFSSDEKKLRAPAVILYFFNNISYQILHRPWWSSDLNALVPICVTVLGPIDPKDGQGLKDVIYSQLVCFGDDAHDILLAVEDRLGINLY